MNENTEISINFKDYILFTLHRWRWMICMAIIFGAAFGGGYLAYKLSNWDKIGEEYNAALDAYEEDYAEYQRQITAWQAEINYQTMKKDNSEEYVRESILYRIDGDNALVTVGDIYIKPVNEEYDAEKIKSVTCLYSEKIKNSIDWAAVGETVNLTDKNVRELVTVEVDIEANVIMLKVLYPNAGSSEMIINKICELAKNESAELEQIEPFEAYLYNVSSYYDRLPEIDENRNYANNKYNDLHTKVEAANTSLESIEEPNKPDPISKKDFIPMTLLLAIGGIIVGVLLVFVACYRKFVHKGIIYSAGEFERISGINSLGVYSKNSKYHFPAFIDKHIDKKSNDYITEDDEVINKKIILNLKNKIKDEKNVLVLGNVNDDNLSNITKILSKEFDDVSFDYSTDIDDSIDNIKKIMESDAVILAMAREKTGLPELMKVKKLVDNYDKDIMGDIIF